MLASILPGLRDVRTPLTLGYLWLVTLWIWFADDVPREMPQTEGLISRLFELGNIVGATAGIAALSFVAYILGALTTLPLEGTAAQKILSVIPILSVDARQTDWEYAEQTHRLQNRIDPALSQLERDIDGERVHRALDLGPDSALTVRINDLLNEFRTEMRRVERASPADLRPRLLVANQELYGEYDRLAAESTFRINICLPFLALGITAAVQLSPWWAVGTVAIVAILLYQGISRGRQAISVIQRAVLQGDIVSNPLQSLLERIESYNIDNLLVPRD